MPFGIKNILSYFKDISLEKSGSEHNPYLEVLLVNGRHQLVTDNAIYSFDDKYDNFFKAFKKIDWVNFPCENVLVLGLGLGSVVFMLEKNFDRKFQYTCVELDPEIIRLAHHYTMKNLQSQIEVIQTDASMFLNLDHNKYDLILMDIFQNAKIPVFYDNRDLVEILKSKLTQNGLLLYNRMNVDDEDISRNEKFRNIFNEVFPNADSINVKDNWVLISDKKHLKK